jgi:hypothetical protein
MALCRYITLRKQHEENGNAEFEKTDGSGVNLLTILLLPW